MPHLKNSVLLPTIAMLVFPASTFSQLQDPPTASQTEQQQAPAKPGNQIPEATQQSVCRGKTVAVTLLERPYGLKLYGRRTSYLQGGILERTRLVIRDRDKFQELWDYITRSISDKPPLPEVDFSREMLIVAAMGPQRSRYEIIVDSACEVDNQLEVVVRSNKINLCGLDVGVLPQTVDIVRLPRTDLPVVFKEIEVTVDCK